MWLPVAFPVYSILIFSATFFLALWPIEMSTLGTIVEFLWPAVYAVTLYSLSCRPVSNSLLLAFILQLWWQLYCTSILGQDVQTEVVLMILLRLAEDVISMDGNLQSNRKKQITQELHTHMEGLFTFFIDTLQKNTAKFRSLKVRLFNEWTCLITTLVCY